MQHKRTVSIIMRAHKLYNRDELVVMSDVLHILCIYLIQRGNKDRISAERNQ
jgi:hypothetical protein